MASSFSKLNSEIRKGNESGDEGSDGQQGKLPTAG